MNTTFDYDSGESECKALKLLEDVGDSHWWFFNGDIFGSGTNFSKKSSILSHQHQWCSKLWIMNLFQAFSITFSTTFSTTTDVTWPGNTPRYLNKRYKTYQHPTTQTYEYNLTSRPKYKFLKSTTILTVLIFIVCVTGIFIYHFNKRRKVRRQIQSPFRPQQSNSEVSSQMANFSWPEHSNFMVVSKI